MHLVKKNIVECSALLGALPLSLMRCVATVRSHAVWKLATALSRARAVAEEVQGGGDGRLSLVLELSLAAKVQHNITQVM